MLDWSSAWGDALKQRQNQFGAIGNLGDQMGQLDLGKAFDALFQQRAKQFQGLFGGDETPTTASLAKTFGKSVGDQQRVSLGLPMESAPQVVGYGLAAGQPAAAPKKGLISSLWDSFGKEVLGALL